MLPTALIFLADRAALYLAAAWPSLPLRTDHEWARAAGVTFQNVRRHGPVLRQHHICRSDGTLDPLAEQYVTAAVAAQLSKLQPRTKKVIHEIQVEDGGD